MPAHEEYAPPDPATYDVCDANGKALAGGMSKEEARRYAPRIANGLGESVWLKTAGSDDVEEVRPESVSP